ncbi:MAG: InlB B-repeat-containing protein [Clostridiales bacterium]|nr:InlB B-repeat-containing protein [Clostridiales bacterium]
MELDKTKTRNDIIFVGVIFIIFWVALLFAGCGKSEVYEPNVNIPTIVSYKTTNGGLLFVDDNPNGREWTAQHIFYGEDADKITAIPNEGYYFVKWSDGVETAVRQDKNITQSFEVVAEFTEINDPIQITYSAKSGGYIRCSTLNLVGRNEINQTVQNGQSGWTVQACVKGGNRDDGLTFIKWSDGVKTDTRQDKNITESFEVFAEFGYFVNYGVSGRGSIVGNANQTVVYGEWAETVTAVPDKGYRFVSWSDGVKTATRQDEYINRQIDVYALFEWRDTDIFTYHYNYATGNYYEDGFTLTRGEVKGKTAIVPVRDYFTFDGWYLDEEFTSKAIDSTGNNLLGEDIFDSPSRDLYAKWIVKDEYVVSYKILMVYVTAIDGSFVGNDGKEVYVHYRMGADVKLQCIELTKRFKETLDSMLDGLVKFEVQSFFTTQSLNEQDFKNSTYETCIYANQIPELINSGILDEYRSVITLFSFDGEDNLSVNWGGSGGEKYATVPLDKAIGRSGSIEQEFDFFGGIIETCVHEFIHTIEFGITAYEFHKAYHPVVPSDISYKLYLLNQFPVDFYGKLSDNRELWKEEYLVEAWRNSEKAGVPYGYWTNDIFDIVIKPECINGRPDGYEGVGTVDTGGYVNYYNSEELDWWRRHNSDIAFGQRVPKGSRTTMFFPKADEGYRFIGWSDGVQDELRVLTDVQEDITLIAYFERLSYTIEYIAGEGGRIEGDLIQTLLTGDRTTWVTAIPDEGYRFVGWSDNNQGYFAGTQTQRSDIVGRAVYDENGERYSRLGFSVTAIFEKIET